jgi:cytochrome c biogenesis protein CcmG/thiol:disulfide interchange protein DsbE
MMVYWRYVPLLMFLLLSALFWRGLALDPEQLPSQQLNHLLPSFSLPSLLTPDQTFNSKALRGRVSLLNVWASWCDSCQDEQAFLMQLVNTRNITLFGLDYKDERVAARAWLKRFGNPYQQLGEDRDGRLAIELGVYGVPETFLLDAAGQIRYRYAGSLTPAVWQREFLPRIQALEST